MKCPICGGDLKTDILENPVMMSFWCEKGHFGTDYYRQPSNAINEALSMIKATLEANEKRGLLLEDVKRDTMERFERFAIHVDSREEMRALSQRNFIEREEKARKKITDLELIRCRDCRFHDPAERDQSLEWLPCMSVDKPSNWFCGSAERKTNGCS